MHDNTLKLTEFDRERGIIYSFHELDISHLEDTRGNFEIVQHTFCVHDFIKFMINARI